MESLKKVIENQRESIQDDLIRLLEITLDFLSDDVNEITETTSRACEIVVDRFQLILDHPQLEVEDE